LLGRTAKRGCERLRRESKVGSPDCPETVPVRYRLLYTPTAEFKLHAWTQRMTVHGLEAFVDYALRMERLSERPTEHLKPTGGRGMVYEFEFPDPNVAECTHWFLIHVYYLPDERHILVADGAYRRDP